MVAGFLVCAPASIRPRREPRAYSSLWGIIARAGCDLPHIAQWASYVSARRFTLEPRVYRDSLVSQPQEIPYQEIFYRNQRDAAVAAHRPVLGQGRSGWLPSPREDTFNPETILQFEVLTNELVRFHGKPWALAVKFMGVELSTRQPCLSL